MIRYNHNIEFNIRDQQLLIKTDRGQQWLTSAIKNTATPWTDWWSRQDGSEWRRDQMDYFLKTFANTYQRQSYLNEPTLYVIYQKGGGYSQAHDMALMHIPRVNTWFFSTTDHTWIHRSSHSNFTLNIQQALGSLQHLSVRQQIYEIDDAIISSLKETV
jgi:hypothetical protein